MEDVSMSHTRPEQPAFSAAPLLAQAHEAAKAGDALHMIEALHASGYLAGLKRTVQKKWRRLAAADIDDCVAEAVNAAYVAVSTGKRVSNLAAWLWKAADNTASDYWTGVYARRSGLDSLPEEITGPELDEVERVHRDALADHRRAEAVRVARRLLAAVGHGQVRDVMELVIAAVEAGEPDSGPEVVADTLGISPAAARSLMSRGFDRLSKAARAEGIELPEELPAEPPVSEEPPIEEMGDE
jgi:DNA-directed RNA polymerase specialized sigma24 family protein